jgi:ribosome maturation factor RimP
MSSPSRDLLREIVEPVCAAHGVDLEALEIAPAGRRRRVSVVVDADGGVDLDRCAEVSRAVSTALDASDVLGDGPYTLEVGSPGVSRPLRLPRHWRRNVGRLVRVALADGGDLVARIVAADDAAVVLDVDGSLRELPHNAIDNARVQVEFRRLDGAEE